MSKVCDFKLLWMYTCIAAKEDKSWSCSYSTHTCLLEAYRAGEMASNQTNCKMLLGRDCRGKKGNSQGWCAAKDTTGNSQAANIQILLVASWIFSNVLSRRLVRFHFTQWHEMFLLKGTLKASCSFWDIPIFPYFTKKQPWNSQRWRFRAIYRCLPPRLPCRGGSWKMGFGPCRDVLGKTWHTEVRWRWVAGG